MAGVTSADTLCLEQRRDQLARTRIVSAPPKPLAEGEVRLRVDRFALTANNITYGVIGEMLGYWNFFPAAEQGWGRIPAMGWADLVESAHPAIEAGGRYYGWYPMARYVDSFCSQSVIPCFLARVPICRRSPSASPPDLMLAAV